MTDPSRPTKPLKILTLDGGGLQAISTLTILNKVLERIAEEHGISGNRKLRPCDVFDTIAGIGAGGWLAIPLGRFRLDINSCLSEWYNLMESIAPKSKTEELRLRLLRHCYFDTERLVEQVEFLTQVYGTGDRLFEPDAEDARTSHVFVAALASDARSYNLFRSYEIPTSAKLPTKLLKGPENPSSFKISRAFGVTGAAKYFTEPWEEQMASSGKVRFSDTKFPEPHNITELALDEMWGIYGTDVPLSVVINVGPGLPNDVDVKQIAQRFSWRSSPSLAQQAASTKRARSPTVLIAKSNNVEHDVKRGSVRFHEDTEEQNSTIEPVIEGEWNRADARTSTLGSIQAGEDAIESDIKKKLNNIHPGNAGLYYRLAPTRAPQGTSRNDSSASGVVLDATLGYLNEPHVDAAINEIVKRILEVVSNC
ncbi:MAG: hypothetical protein ALECFALPRED_005790 [Alectoria fallacina]|uniref:PNPLA domain-containing protein n=1 Tax=Alectoria fallacina TaxID=1903189 RepID=A0A8H3G3H5_9LECA|nr:MAG: hypothetical protein ALECFALPRED_005790 [Alectoria fallacina]